MPSSSNSILALDVGGRRIGVARANPVARIAQPLTTLTNDADIISVLQKLIQAEDAGILVVGLPRNLEGQATAQTHSVEAFVEALKRHVTIPIYWQDEAVTSKKAESELSQRGKIYSKGDIDALAATYILEDFLHTHAPEE
jgi:putative holliday junction resolvase